MIINRVTYTVKPEFVATNRGNIERVMRAARALGDDGMKYSSFVVGDAAFMHLAVFRDDDSQKALGALPEFQQFQQELRPNLVTGPDAIDAEMVGSTFDWF